MWRILLPSKMLLEQASAGDFLMIMAYIPRSPEVDTALEALRRRVTERYSIATTMGYGPGSYVPPGTNLFLQITMKHVRDLDIPGTPFTFGVLADAQALGDLQALRPSGRRSVRVDACANLEEGIHKMADELA